MIKQHNTTKTKTIYWISQPITKKNYDWNFNESIFFFQVYENQIRLVGSTTQLRIGLSTNPIKIVKISGTTVKTAGSIDKKLKAESFLAFWPIQFLKSWFWYF